jgi:membrane protein
MSGKVEDRSVAQLVNEASEQVSRLVRDEMRLAVEELRQKGKHAGAGAGLLGGAGVLAFYGGAVLIASAILALSLVLDPWLAALLVGAVLLLFAGVAGVVGKKQVQSAAPPVPQQAVASVKSDIEAIKEGMHR